MIAERTLIAERGGLPALTLVLGGARSGKSAFAEGLLAPYARPCYVATAKSEDTEPGDAEMALRIAAHRARRGAAWRTVEAPLDLPAAIAAEAAPRSPVLVDCLTLWLANIMAAGRDLTVSGDALLAACARARGPVVLVSNEVGQGIVPENALARRFRDEAGRLNQRVAAAANRVILITAGLPRILKDSQPRHGQPRHGQPRNDSAAP